MQIEGVENASTKAGIVSAIIHLDEFQQRPNLKAFDQASRFVTNDEAMDRFHNDPAVAQAIQYTIAYYKNYPGMSRGTLGALYYNLHKYGSAPYVDQFLEQLRLANGPADSPAMVLRARLQTAQDSPQKQSRLNRSEVFRLTIHAYNKFARGQSWKRAKTPSVFPRISSRVAGP